MPQRPSVAVVTDSTSDLSPDIAAAHGITVVPLTVHIGSESFRDGIDISTDELMHRMEDVDNLPITSRPSVSTFEQAFSELSGDYDEVVCITLSSRLGGAYKSAHIAANNVAEQVEVHVVDSLNVSYGLGFQVLHAADLASEGMDAANIATTLRAEVQHYHVVAFVETLEHLRREGSIGKATQMVGSLLQLRPLLRIDEGQVIPFERARTRGKAIDAIADFATSITDSDAIAVLYNTTPDEAHTLADRLAGLTPDHDITIARLGPVINAYLGPDILGVAIKERLHD